MSYPDGVNWLDTYIKAVYAKMQKRNSNLWLMQNDAFMGASFWTSFCNKGDKIAFDSVRECLAISTTPLIPKIYLKQHLYFFAAAGGVRQLCPRNHMWSSRCHQARGLPRLHLRILVADHVQQQSCLATRIVRLSSLPVRKLSFRLCFLDYQV